MIYRSYIKYSSRFQKLKKKVPGASCLSFINCFIWWVVSKVNGFNKLFINWTAYLLYAEGQMVPSDLYCRFLQFGFISVADSSFHTSQRYVLIFQKWWSSGAVWLPCLHWKDPPQGCDLSRRGWNKPKKLSCMIALEKADLEEKLSSG